MFFFSLQTLKKDYLCGSLDSTCRRLVATDKGIRTHNIIHRMSLLLEGVKILQKLKDASQNVVRCLQKPYTLNTFT